MFVDVFDNFWLRQYRKTSAKKKTYAEILRDTYGASEIWPLVNISAGTTIPAFINSARNGTLQGWDLKNAAGPVPNTLAPYSDGVNDYGNIFTSNGSNGLVDIFNGNTGSVFGWWRVYDSSVWTDGAGRYLFSLAYDNLNFIYVFKNTANNQMLAQRRASGTQVSVTRNGESTTDWFSVGVSWDTVANQFKFYFNGTQNGATQTNINTWTIAGQLSSSRSTIMSATTTPTLIWNGYGSYLSVKFGSIWSDADFLAMHNAAATAGADV